MRTNRQVRDPRRGTSSPGSAARIAAWSLRGPVRALRPSALAFVAAGCLALGSAGCASDAPTRPESPESVQPEGLADTRAEIADRRASMRDLMDQNLARPAAPEAPQSVVGSVFDFVGKAGTTVFDVLSLRAFGVW